MQLKQVALGTALLLVSSTILVATGTVSSPGPVFALSASPLALAGLSLIFGRSPQSPA